MFERFTERARQVVVLAQDEARLLKHDYIGTEHLLLGLLREEEGIAARVLESLDVTVENVRAEVARIIGQGDAATPGQIPFTPRAKKVLELSLREALSTGHSYIGTEHVLLGLAREDEGVAARILLHFGVDADRIRDTVGAALELSRGRALADFENEQFAGPAISDLEEERLEALESRIDAELALGRHAELVRDLRKLVRENPLRERFRAQLMLALYRAGSQAEALEAYTEARRTLVDELGLEPSPELQRLQQSILEHSPELRPPRRRRRRPELWLAVGWTLFAVALGIGILIGWAIWGI